MLSFRILMINGFTTSATCYCGSRTAIPAVELPDAWPGMLTKVSLDGGPADMIEQSVTPVVVVIVTVGILAFAAALYLMLRAILRLAPRGTWYASAIAGLVLLTCLAGGLAAWFMRRIDAPGLIGTILGSLCFSAVLLTGLAISFSLQGRAGRKPRERREERPNIRPRDQ
jgi:hypothetical protein